MCRNFRAWAAKTESTPPHLPEEKTLTDAEELHYYHRYFRHCSVCVKWHPHMHTHAHIHTCTHKENDRDRDVIAGSQHHVGNKQFERSLKSWSAKKKARKKKTQTEMKNENKSQDEEIKTTSTLKNIKRLTLSTRSHTHTHTYVHTHIFAPKAFWNTSVAID